MDKKLKFQKTDMIEETHPITKFIPKGSKVLIIGSFPPKGFTKKDFFYPSRHTQFWKILSSIFDKKLDDPSERKSFVKEKKIGMTDIILTCIRKDGKTASDSNLIIKEHNDILKILKDNPSIRYIFFTSKLVEKLFDKFVIRSNKNKFRNSSKKSSSKKIKTDSGKIIYFDTLISPSPRRTIRLDEKIRDYKKKFRKAGLIY